MQHNETPAEPWTRDQRARCRGGLPEQAATVRCLCPRFGIIRALKPGSKAQRVKNGFGLSVDYRVKGLHVGFKAGPLRC